MHVHFGAQPVPAELTYAYTWRFAPTGPLQTLPDCLQNHDAAEYVSLVTKTPCRAPLRIHTRCAFDAYGAPLIVLCDRLEVDAAGHLRYANCLEVVLWEQGINVWHLWRAQDGQIRWRNLLEATFPVAAGVPHDLTVQVDEAQFIIEALGRRWRLYVPQLYPAFHAGITACEGINRFYELQIEPLQQA